MIHQPAVTKVATELEAACCIINSTNNIAVSDSTKNQNLKKKQ